jgi:hypothetical protein
MRRLISEKEAGAMSLEEKYHVITSYMRGGGIRGLIGPGPDEIEDDIGDLSEEERRMVEEEFEKLFAEDSRFRMALEGTDLAKLDIRDKYELIIAYSRRPEDSSETGSRKASHTDDPEKVRVEGEYVFYQGKKYKRVQLDGEKSGEDDDDEYLMDEHGNIYDS